MGENTPKLGLALPKLPDPRLGLRLGAITQGAEPGNLGALLRRGACAPQSQCATVVKGSPLLGRALHLYHEAKSLNVGAKLTLK